MKNSYWNTRIKNNWQNHMNNKETTNMNNKYQFLKFLFEKIKSNRITNEIWHQNKMKTYLMSNNTKDWRIITKSTIYWFSEFERALNWNNAWEKENYKENKRYKHEKITTNIKQHEITATKRTKINVLSIVVEKLNIE